MAADFAGPPPTNGGSSGGGTAGEPPQLVDRAMLYRLIMAQLRADGHAEAAAAVSRACFLPPPLTSSTKLLELALAGAETGVAVTDATTTTTTSTAASGSSMFGGGVPADVPPPPHLSLGSRAGETTAVPTHVIRYAMGHTAPCRVARFSPDGQFICTGAGDGTVLVASVERMKQATSGPGAPPPAVRSFTEHAAAVNDAAFHPRAPVLATASRDGTVRLYDLSHAQASRAFATVQETHCVRSVAFHPRGEHILVATDHCAPRVYDAHTLRAFLGSGDAHRDAVVAARWSADGRLFVTASNDGDVKVFDARTAAVVRTIEKAHQGHGVSSAAFSRSTDYILTCGRDGAACLWDARVGERLQAYLGCSAQERARGSTCFSYAEQHVAVTDDVRCAVAVFDAATAEAVAEFRGHDGPVRCVVASPVEDVFATASEDGRMRLWGSATA